MDSNPRMGVTIAGFQDQCISTALPSFREETRIIPNILLPASLKFL